MKRLNLAAASLALALLAASMAAPAQASDFYPPSPVPSTRDTAKAKTTATARKDTNAQNQTRHFILNQKIVKTTKPTEANPTPAAKVPGAL
ncbi:MAG: hypothetical protein AB7E46_03755 [Desulfovibrio sp.]|jgi:opacity protein-like surface antigen